MRTFEEWREGLLETRKLQLPIVIEDALRATNSLIRLGWNACEAEYEHKMANKIQAYEMKIAVLQKRFELLEARLSASSENMDRSLKNFDRLKELAEAKDPVVVMTLDEALFGKLEETLGIKPTGEESA